ncbi:glycosyltransferase [Thermodesulfovibrio yellowstonii]|uniref:Capsular polysaccharide biosynthesis protein n=1 Tax=Thermodesulfovibrio yellowstonii TaxID=28262 RepID=A0A9W6LJR2_9BACT|nr:glycosyltransferase [Thermodesulfovibrio islandicus]GLI52413.1 capsular polysaccharide biosynthesis protein [Thermodesulfovibrio islandicus]
MKILMLADPNSPHTIKWVTSLAKRDIDIMLIGLGDLKVKSYEPYPNIKVEMIGAKVTREEGSLKKISYLKSIPFIRKEIKKFKPDIVHSHYASSYGLLGVLSGFHPFIASVWGSDVYSFPDKSIFHRKILEYVLKKADVICSTSHTMAKRTRLFIQKDKNINVVPFGVDVNVFKPMKVKSLFNENDIVIGTVKTLEKKYGIEYLIKAFKILSDKYPELPLKLLIVGGGSLEEDLKKLAKDLGIWNKTIFTGKVPFEDVPIYHNMLSVSVSVSESESFGVAVVEAMACGKPVVVSNVGGLPEVVENGKTGFIVPPKNPEKTAEAIEKFLLDKTLIEKMGKFARDRVINLYNWDKCVDKMIKIYEEAIIK